MLRVFRSNRLEKLADALADNIKAPLTSPFSLEWIGVMSVGMRSWISREMASRLGIWAGARFSFPREIIETILTASGAAPFDIRTFSENRLVWSIMALLPELLDDPRFHRIAQYLKRENSGLLTWQLSKQIAHVFDEYALYRPDVVLGWEAGADDHWQAVLWRRLVERHGSCHIARAVKTLFDDGIEPKEQGYPFERICLFGISLVPPLYLKLFSALPETLPVTLFVHTPSREWWADTGSRETWSEENDGHPLLTALGRIPKDFQWILEENAPYIEPNTELYVDPGEAVLATGLHRVQSDILNLKRSHPPGKPTIDDGTIRVHACHSAIREIEVLKDQLFDIFERSRLNITPDDVLVLAPDITRYIPYIEAVFNGGSQTIPFNIAGAVRPPPPVASAILRLLSLPDTRFTVQDIFDLLLLEPVRKNFNLNEWEVIEGRSWLLEAGVRWGRDAAHREKHRHPPFHENTWRFGLERLLLGLALPDDSETLFCGVSPVGNLDNTLSATLGKMIRFFDTIFSIAKELDGHQTADEWRQTVEAAIDKIIFVEGDNEREQRRIISALQDMSDMAVAANFEGKISFKVVQKLLFDAIESGANKSGWHPNGVTFSDLLVMRGIPKPVVAVLGLNDREFPRNRQAPGFDLMGQNPRRGDRSVNADDRYQFLEAILSARDYFILSHVGLSIQDGSIRPPSVVISELIELLVNGHGADEKSIVLYHPLQPFSHRYFTADKDPRLLNFNQIDFVGACASMTPKEEQTDFFDAPLTPASDQEVIKLPDLVAFFSSPSDYLARQRLHAQFAEELSQLPEFEPLGSKGEETHLICQKLLEIAVVKNDIDDPLPFLRSEGLLPLGKAAPIRLRKLMREITPIIDAARPHAVGEQLTPLEVDISVDTSAQTVKLIGTLDRVWPSARLEYGYFPVTGRWLIKLWLQHLAMAAQDEPGYPLTSVLVGRNKNQSSKKISLEQTGDSPSAILADLVEVFRTGEEYPVPFVPKYAFNYAHAVYKGKEATTAYNDVISEWRTDTKVQSQAFSTMYRGKDPFDISPSSRYQFDALALRIFTPLIKCMSRGETK